MTGPDFQGIPALRGVLEGQKVRLRAFDVSDLTPTYLSWLNDLAVLRFSNQRFSTHTVESCRAYLESFSGTANHFLAILGRDTGSMLGTMTVYRNLHHGTADLGILIGERGVWGNGIGTDAFCTVVGVLLNSAEIRKITAGTLAVNTSMVRIMEKAGMRHEATRYAQEMLEGIAADVVYYARFRKA